MFSFLKRSKDNDEVKFAFDDEFAKNLERKLEISKAAEFSKFITQKDSSNLSKLDLVKGIQKSLNFEQCKPEKELFLDEKIIAQYLNEFYSTYLPKKAPEVKLILEQKHPYFIDSDGNSHVKFEYASKDDSGSYVGHRGRNSCLDFKVVLRDSVDDIRVTAHELAHALSSHNEKFAELCRTGESDAEINEYSKKDFERDGIVEIESLIVEGLLNRYLLAKGIYNENDLLNYKNGQVNSLLNETTLITEEQEILKVLNRPVTAENLNDLVENSSGSERNKLIERLNRMNGSSRDSSYMFRYVVGRVVADQWMREFEKADAHKQVAMLDKFQDYLDNTHTLNVDSACHAVLGLDFLQVMQNYVKNKFSTNKKVMTNSFDFQEQEK